MLLDSDSDEPATTVMGAESQQVSLGVPVSGPPKKNSKYYMDDPMAIFLVENQLFKVHRHFLVEESEVFKWMFVCPSGGSEPEGHSNERPIPLPGVHAVELETLLDFFYTEKFQRYTACLRDWINLLAISTRFDFQRLRECAINAIDYSRWPQSWLIVIDPIEKIVLAERHDIPHWLRIAYVAICERGRPLEESEAEKIGYRKTILLARAREAIRNPQHDPPALTVSRPYSPGIGSPVWRALLDKTPVATRGHASPRVGRVSTHFTLVKDSGSLSGSRVVLRGVAWLFVYCNLL
ncbi:hypothetical protein B0H15DRAFT_832572 [Mycena belliarum]|uniref:BTB domain-containing protein n=1 Tax=Mycena belliarum TaxID=1033014 RepID=A0AAD6U6H1_9AGAR|nr:hypothetical protein B0H15DRAFT_832572 [Mycena belliae]